MKFSTSKKQLKSSLLKLSKVIPSRSTLPILSNVLLSIKENKSILRATDLEVSLNLIYLGFLKFPNKKIKLLIDIQD